MKIIFNRRKISADITPLMCAVSNKSTSPACEGILIEAKMPDTCIMSTYDLEKGMRITVEATVIEEGCYIINAAKFSQTLKVMEGEEVELTVDAKLHANIVSGKSSHKMNAMAGEDFPQLPSLQSEMGFTLKQSVLRNMLSKTMYAMGVNDKRLVLNGAFFKIEEGCLTVISCDSYKLAKCEMKTEIENNNTDGEALRYQFIVPLKTVNELFRLLSDDEEETVRIYVMRKHMVFMIGELTFFTLLIEGQYIDYDRIIMRNQPITATVNRDELIAALERAALITEERIANTICSSVKLEFEGNILKITANSPAGNTYDEVDIDHTGNDISISFRNRYLIDSIRVCEEERVKISLSTPLSSMNLEPVVGEDEESIARAEGREDLFMILPVRTKD
ncbi:MAG: DNA polymerase III subunit beta [Clostridia bacterium]|nr:DNA polymerase III subunit beta [Clostridia bacterium]